MITIKPHHFVDIITVVGEGRKEFQPHPYGHAMHSISKQILGNPDITLRIELGIDDICLPCLHNVNGLCDDTIDTSFRPQAPELKREYNLLIDHRWCERLGLQQDNELTAREFCLRIRDHVDNIEDIYRETPCNRTANRHAKLKRGIINFLQ